MIAKKKPAPQKPKNRSGKVRWITVTPNLDAAIEAEAARDPNGEDYTHAIRRMVRDWLEGRTSDHPLTVQAETAIKIGRPKKAPTAAEDPS